MPVLQPVPILPVSLLVVMREIFVLHIFWMLASAGNIYMYTHYYNPKYHLGKTRTIRSRMPVLHPGRVSDVSSLVVMRGIFLLSILWVLEWAGNIHG